MKNPVTQKYSWDSFDKGAGRFLLALALILLVSFLVRDVFGYDFWAHLKAGQWIVDNHEVPKLDIFSYTASSRPYFDHAWLFQVLLYGVYKLGGILSIHILKIILYVSAFACLFKFIKKKNYIISSFFIFPAIMLAHDRFFVRPEMITFLFVGLYFIILNDYKHKKTNSIYILPFIQLIWANMHGLFMIGLVIVVSYLAGEFLTSKLRWYEGISIKGKKYNKLIAVFCLMVIACFINPHGIKGFTFPFLLYSQIGGGASHFLRMVAEHSSSFSGTTNTVYFWALTILTAITFFIKVKRLNITYLIIYSSFLFLSFKANRNLSLFALAAVLIAISNISNTSGENDNRLKIISLSGISIIMAVFMVILTVNIVSNRYYIRMGSARRFGLGVSRFKFPEKAVDFIEENNIQGNILNDNGIGGYLIWRLYPGRKIFIDGRWEVYGTEFLNRYWESLGNIALFRKLTDEYNINYVLFSHASMESQFLSAELYKDSGWNLIYFDDISMVFIRNIEKNRDIIENNSVDFALLMNKYNGKPDGVQSILSQKGLFFIAIGLYDNAEYEFTKAIDINPDDTMGYYNRGSAYDMMNYLDKAVLDFNKAIELDHKNALAYNNRGISYGKKELYNEAILDFSKVIKLDSGNAMAYKNRSITYKKMGKHDLSEMDKAKVLKYQ